MELVQVNPGSIRTMPDRTEAEITSFDSEYRAFRTSDGDLYSEKDVLTGVEVAPGRHSPLWHGIRVTVAYPLLDFCWAPYSVGDLVIDESDLENVITSEIVEIQVIVHSNSADIRYVFRDGNYMTHGILCIMINEGFYRVVTNKEGNNCGRP